MGCSSLDIVGAAANRNCPDSNFGRHGPLTGWRSSPAIETFFLLKNFGCCAAAATLGEGAGAVGRADGGLCWAGV